MKDKYIYFIIFTLMLLIGISGLIAWDNSLITEITINVLLNTLMGLIALMFLFGGIYGFMNQIIKNNIEGWRR